MRFHLIDRVDDWQPGRGIHARKLTSSAEEYWRREDGVRVMPRALILEVFCQAGAWLVVLSTGSERRPALLSVREARFLGDAHPGDVLEVDGRVEAMDLETAVLSGTVTASGRLLLEAHDVMCVLLDAGSLDGPDQTERMSDLLTRS